MSRRRTRGKPIATSFIAHSVEMRRSPAWRALPHDSRLFLDFLELEHMAHGGRANGELRAPYAGLERAGIRRKSIAAAIRACVTLGFVSVTRQGQPAISTHRTASTYRLTYLVSRDDTPPRTDDWKGIASEAAALDAIGQAKAKRSAEHVRRARKGNTIGAVPQRVPCTG